MRSLKSTGIILHVCFFVGLRVAFSDHGGIPVSSALKAGEEGSQSNVSDAPVSIQDKFVKSARKLRPHGGATNARLKDKGTDSVRGSGDIWRSQVVRHGRRRSAEAEVRYVLATPVNSTNCTYEHRLPVLTNIGFPPIEWTQTGGNGTTWRGHPPLSSVAGRTGPNGVRAAVVGGATVGESVAYIRCRKGEDKKGGTNFVTRYPTPHRPSMQHRMWPRDPLPQPRVLPGARPVPWPAANGGTVRERLRLDRCSLRRYPRHDSRATLRDRQRADSVDRSANPRRYTQEPDVAGGRPGGMASSRSASRRDSRADVVVQQ